MTTHAFLPKLKSGTENRFPDPPRVSVWDERPNTHLEMLAEAIEVSSVGHRIHSIPDPWARALLFERALYDENHLLHKVIEGEWRGLLAVIGLRERRNFLGLSTREANLSGARTPGTFSSVLTQLLPAPNHLLSSDTPWGRFYTFRWQRQPFDRNRPQAFAFTTPTTLVCTGVQYQNALSTEEVPWFLGGVLQDPVGHLSPRELSALARWLLTLSQQLTNSNWIVKRLVAFAANLDPAARLGSDEDVLGDKSLDMHYGVYRALARPAKGEAGGVSDVEIVTSKQNAPRYLLVDSSLGQQWNVSPNEINVFRNVTLATSGQYTTTGKTSGKLPESGGLSWCTPEFFFSDRLIYESNPAPAFPGCLPVKTSGSQRRNVVLPLNPQVLELFTPTEIADRCSIEWLPNGGVECSLRLSLKSGDSPKPVRIRRVFSDAETVSVAFLPLICLWPDFRLQDAAWKTYFTFQLWPGEKEELSIKPWSDGEREPQAHRRHILDQHRFQVYRNDSHPEALICETPYFDALKQLEVKAKGILLLQMPEVAQKVPSSSSVVGVDFGSTCSNVFTSIGHGRPEAVSFRSRVRAITDFDPTRFNESCVDMFVPGKDWLARNILSVFHDFGDPPGKSDTQREILRDGHILYADDPRKFISNKDRRRIMSNLKWGEERERIVARDFLIQLCLQAAAEVAAQGSTGADLRFSYPTAFSRTDLTQFKGNWGYVASEVSRLTNVQLILDQKDEHNREALTATRFFSDHVGNADISGGAVTIDIGGGTTDFAVWKKLGLTAHSSIILAGRDILLAPLRLKPQMLNEIEPQISLDNLQNGPRDGAFNAQLDAIIARYGEELIKALPLRAPRRTVQGLLSVLEVGLCGITYYAGMLVRRLVEGGILKLERRMSLFIGGNGSKMFRWCALGASLEGSEIYDKAAASFRAGANAKELKIAMQLSVDPKAEVAYGLVCEPIEEDVRAEEFARPLAGESFLLRQDKKNWNDSPSGEDIQQRRVEVDRALPMFSAFLESIGRSVDEDVLDRIGGRVDNRFLKRAQEIEELHRKNPGTKLDDLVRNEPIFIMALKGYLEIEIDAWARLF